MKATSPATAPIDDEPHLRLVEDEPMKLSIGIEYRPGRSKSPQQLDKLVEEMRAVAATCFDEVPIYQALTGDRIELERAVIAVARDEHGNLRGFCSTLILPTTDGESVLHLGLTCVDPAARGRQLTHKLTSRAVTAYMIRGTRGRRVWVSNVACVLSSLGNVAKHFDDVYPSPFAEGDATEKQLTVAADISSEYRTQIAIDRQALFNPQTFVFEGSVPDTPFAKSAHDTRFHHRDESLTKFYSDLLDFNRGDEVLQVGSVSLLSVPRHWLKRLRRR